MRPWCFSAIVALLATSVPARDNFQFPPVPVLYLRAFIERGPSGKAIPLLQGALDCELTIARDDGFTFADKIAESKAIIGEEPTSVPYDSDGDGIPDLSDNCPGTPPEARGLIDIRGCPIDTDCDGIPDYRDSCPDNHAGAAVDNLGCPMDGDRDGIPDGLDDCPGTEPGLAVDGSGCIDLTVLEKPLVLNIAYLPGAVEIDSAAKEQLDRIAAILLKASEIKVEINGYTDNVGLADANRALSQKRADWIRDYLVDSGIASERLIPIGRGETNFAASNSTRVGREQNRRIEMIFYK
jgi:OOP family OmpA-OmpF porin